MTSSFWTWRTGEASERQPRRLRVAIPSAIREDDDSPPSSLRRRSRPNTPTSTEAPSIRSASVASSLSRNNDRITPAAERNIQPVFKHNYHVFTQHTRKFIQLYIYRKRH